MILQILTFFIYVIYIYKRHGKLKSVSHSYYKLEDVEKWMFTGVMYVLGILQCFHSEIHALFFLSGAGLCFIGAANAFEDLRMTYWVHVVATVIAIGSTIIAFCIILPGLSWAGVLILGIQIPIFIYFLDKKYVIWNIEIYYILLIGTLLSLIYLFL